MLYTKYIISFVYYVYKNLFKIYPHQQYYINNQNFIKKTHLVKYIKYPLFKQFEKLKFFFNNFKNYNKKDFNKNTYVLKKNNYFFFLAAITRLNYKLSIFLKKYHYWAVFDYYDIQHIPFDTDRILIDAYLNFYNTNHWNLLTYNFTKSN